MVTHDPLHGSGRAEFPHPALTSGTDAKALQRIWMMNVQRWQPAADEPLHTVPPHAAILTAPRERAMPEPAHLRAEPKQRRHIHRHAVITHMAPDYCAEPLTHCRDGLVQAPPELGLDLAQFGL